MAELPRPGWLSELIGVVQRLCAADRSRGTPAKTGQPRRLGRVTPDAEKGDGWFWLDVAGRFADDDQLETAYLAPGEGAERRRYQLIEAVQDGNLLKVRAGAHAPRDGLFLWIPGRETGLLEKSLLDGLSRIDRFDMVNRFGAGQADPVPPVAADSGIMQREGLNQRQAEAWTACRAPGVHLVWGPPGTGKTKVIALALQDLVSQGKSVLLVSSTNIAVDNALGRAAQWLDPAPGVLVRVGIPQDPDVASDSRICLQRMIRERQGALDRKRLGLEEQITACRKDPDIALLDQTRAELADFDRDAFTAAVRRLENQEWLSARAADLGNAQDRAATAADAEEKTRQRLAGTRQAHQDAASAREHISQAGQLAEELQNLELERNRAAAEELRMDGERGRLTEALKAATGLRGRRERKRLSALLADADQHLGTARARRSQAEELLITMSRQLAQAMDQHRRAAHPHTALTLARLDSDLATSEDAWRQSQHVLSTLVKQAQAIREQVSYAQREPAPTPADREMVARAREQQLPQKLAGIKTLEERSAARTAEIRKLEGQHDQVMSELSEQGRQVARQLISNASVVAATLARLRLNPDLYGREYDHVIIDEVAAACPPEVVYAASRARLGVTLLGDFLQNGPIVPQKFRRSDDPAVQRWYHRDCFSIFGIRDPGTARANPGCVVLSEQYRFGPIINEFANAVAYGGVLTVAGSGPPAGGQEVVLVDVDGLGDDLTLIRPGPGGTSRWWPVGAMLARALAARHIRADASASPAKVGVVTPYRAQRDLIRDVLTESGASPRIEAGTAHQFQGREFDTMIFDLVEDGHGWIARGQIQPGASAPDGLRVFNVGITRARRRLYVIANGAVVQRARGGPLSALQRLVRAGCMSSAPPRSLISRRNRTVTDRQRSRRALRDHVTLIDLYDEDRLPEELASTSGNASGCGVRGWDGGLSNCCRT